MQVPADQPKKVETREIIATKGPFSLELVTFSTANGPAYGCRGFSNNQSEISPLFDSEEEATAWFNFFDDPQKAAAAEPGGKE